MLEPFLSSTLAPLVTEVAKSVFTSLTSEGIKKILKEVYNNWKSSSPEEVFKTILLTAFFMAFAETLREFGIKNIHGNEEITKKLLKLEGINPKLEEFDFENFQQNEVLNQIWEHYKRTLLSNENQNETLKNVLQEKETLLFGNTIRLAENYFYRILDLEKSDEDRSVYRLKKWIENESRYASIFKYKRVLYKVATEFEEPILRNEKVFKIPLKDLYIEPSFRIYEKSIDSEKEILKKEDPPRCQIEDRIGEERGSFYFYTPEKVKLTKFIPRLLKNENPFEFIKPISPKMVLLLGYPGEGKTSFTKKLVYDYVNHKLDISQQPFLVRFRDISKTKDGNLLENPFEVINKHIKRKYGIELQSWEGKFLILDGLDEYIVPQNLTNEEIKDFIGKFYDAVRDEENTLILITSRYLPTEVLNKIATDFQTLVLELREFDKEDITRYLNNFEKALEKLNLPNLQEFKEKLKSIKDGLIEIFSDSEEFIIDFLDLEDENCHLKELINQPIILFLLIYDCLIEPEKECPLLKETTSRTQFYERVFNKLLKRFWETGSNPLPQEVREKYPDFLRELAFLMEFKKGSLVATKEEIGELETFKSIKNTLSKEFKEEDIFTDILVGFYFRENNYEVEFLHKSFQEYLTAEYIYYKMLNLPDDEGLVEKVIWDTFSHRKMTPEIRQYLEELIDIHRERDKDKLQKFKERIEKFFPNLLKKNFVLNTDDVKDIFKKSLWCFRNFWIFANKVAPIEFKDTETKNRFACMVKYIQSCEETYLEDIPLKGIDLGGADLKGADLKGADLRGVNLMRANLMGANLRRADLMGADLMRTNLMGANLMGADLRGVNLMRANLMGVNLRRADLRGAIFEPEEIKKAKNWDKAIYDDEMKKKLGLV